MREGKRSHFVLAAAVALCVLLSGGEMKAWEPLLYADEPGEMEARRESETAANATGAGAAGAVGAPAEAELDGGADVIPPTATILMDGVESSDGRYYYRADNCRIRVIFRDNEPLAGGTYCCEIDGRRDTRRTANAADGEYFAVVEYTAPEVAGLLTDGEHSVTFQAADAAGNRGAEPAFDSAGLSLTASGGVFLLDTTPPRAGFRISAPGAARREVSEIGDRYYFNRAAAAVVEIRDAWVEAGGVQVRRGEFSAGEYDASSIVLREPGTALQAVHTEGLLTFRDMLDADGVYRYFVGGCDRAGNPVEFEDGFARDGTTRHIVVDTTPPRGILTVFDGERVRFRMRTDGTVIFAEPYCSAASLRVELRADTEVEHSPVTLTASIRRSGEGEARLGGGAFQYGCRKETTVKGACSFQAVKMRLVDLAGNETGGEDSGLIYMDGEPPGIVEMRPGIRAISGKLYNADVPLRLRIVDPDRGGGSGVGDVLLRIYKNGGTDPAEEIVLHRGVQGAFEGPYREKRKIYEFETEAVVKSRHDADDIRVVVAAADNAGNGTERELRLGIDAVPPEVSVEFTGGEAENGGFFREAREAVITVRERHFDPARMAVEMRNGEDIGEWEQAGGDVWRRRVRFEKEGSCTLRVTGTDALGNAVSTEKGGAGGPWDFVIDRTPPKITAVLEGSAVRNGLYAGGAGTLLVRMEEANFGGEHGMRLLAPDGTEVPVSFGKTQEDGVHLFQYHFDGEGSYLLRGAAKDLAGNRSSPLDWAWVVDTTAPEIEVSGVRNGSSNLEAPEISVRVFDRHLDGERVALSLTGSRGGEIPLTADWGAAASADSGGTEASSGNRGTPLGDGTADSRSGEAGSSSFELHFHLPELSKDDYYRLRVTAADLAGNEAAKETAFSVNRDGPRFTVLEPRPKNGCVRGPVTPRIRVDDVDAVSVVAASLNGRAAPFTARDGEIVFEEIAEDGKYVLGLEVKDAAGHRASLPPLEFAVDQTPPSLAVSIAEGRKWFYVGDVTVEISSDDAGAAFSELWLDGEPLAEQVRLEKGRARLVVPGERRGGHALTAKLIDTAGNESEAAVLRFRIAEDAAGGLLPLLLLAAASSGLLALRNRERRRSRAISKKIT